MGSLVVTAEQVTAIGTAAQAVLLAGAFFVAYRQLNEARSMRVAQARPYVVVSLQLDASSPQLILLVVENLGHTVAHDVKITIDPPLRTTFDDGRGNDWGPLSEGIPTLVPGQRMTHFVESALQRASRPDLPSRSVATVTCRSDFGKPDGLNESFILDFDVWKNTHYVRRRTIHDVGESLDTIAKRLKAVTVHLNGLRVYVRDEAEYNERVRRTQYDQPEEEGGRSGPEEES
jgi:hypothetical protein